MEITSLEALKQMKKYDEIELPPFTYEGTPFCVKAKMPSMMQLISSGKIPNTLLSVAMDMFDGKTPQVVNKAAKDAKVFKELGGMIDILADACLVEPTYKDIKKLGIELTDQQLMAILTYTQGGVKALESFRNQ